MLDRDDLHVIALAGFAVGVGDELGDDEHRDPAGPRRGVRGLGEYQMDDVLGEVVLAPGDVDLLSGDAVATVVLLHGLGRQGADIGSGVRLREAHRARPLTGCELLQVGRLLFIRAVLDQCVDGALGQERSEGERHVGRCEHLLERDAHCIREAPATRHLGKMHPGPAGVDELAVCLLESFGSGHRPVVVQDGTDLVTDPVGGCNHFGEEPAGLGEHPYGGVGIGVLEAVQVRHPLEVGDVIFTGTPGSTKAIGAVYSDT